MHLFFECTFCLFFHFFEAAKQLWKFTTRGNDIERIMKKTSFIYICCRGTKYEFFPYDDITIILKHDITTSCLNNLMFKRTLL